MKRHGVDEGGDRRLKEDSMQLSRLFQERIGEGSQGRRGPPREERSGVLPSMRRGIVPTFNFDATCYYSVTQGGGHKPRVYTGHISCFVRSFFFGFAHEAPNLVEHVVAGRKDEGEERSVGESERFELHAGKGEHGRIPTERRASK